MLLKAFSNIKTFSLNIIPITFLIIFELFSQHFEIHLFNIAIDIHQIFLKNIFTLLVKIFIIIKTFGLLINTMVFFKTLKSLYLTIGYMHINTMLLKLFFKYF